MPIRRLHADAPNFAQQLDALLQRRANATDAIDASVREIIENIRAHGDAALLDYANQFDNARAKSIADLTIDRAQMQAALARIDADTRRALELAHARILDYHRHETQKSWQITDADGNQLGQQITPLARVGVYAPGGKAAYPSSVLMTATPAKVAGVQHICLASPAPHDAVLAAAALAGVDCAFALGGAHAIAALAYGTESVPAADKIAGPGNAWVNTAKRMVFGRVGVDMVAGPSEVVIICDQSVCDSARAEWAAMDLFAQAEHDETAQAIAITDSPDAAQAIEDAAMELLPQMPRRRIIEKSLRDNGAIIQTDDLSAAAAVSNQIAPEHLELMVLDADALLPQIVHAGAIFCGAFSAEVLGDYCAGPSHVLPTSSNARFASPLGVYDFQKRSSIIRASEVGAKKMAQTAATLARVEGLEAHARAAECRLGKSARAKK